MFEDASQNEVRFPTHEEENVRALEERQVRKRIEPDKLGAAFRPDLHVNATGAGMTCLWLKRQSENERERGYRADLVLGHPPRPVVRREPRQSWCQSHTEKGSLGVHTRPRSDRRRSDRTDTY
jgi:hypothetical protein